MHIYIDKAADPEKALRVVLNAKTRRTGICGAAECLLIHQGYRGHHRAGLIRALMDAGVEVRADETLQAIEGTEPPATGRLGLRISRQDHRGACGRRSGRGDRHIRTHHSQHTDCIITEDDAAADQFFARLDSAILMRNASTQFADGGEFGMGAEIGIATGKMHARGPVGAAQLTSFKYLVEGDGTVRG